MVHRYIAVLLLASQPLHFPYLSNLGEGRVWLWPIKNVSFILSQGGDGGGVDGGAIWQNVAFLHVV